MTMLSQLLRLCSITMKRLKNKLRDLNGGLRGATGIPRSGDSHVTTR
jgi:hypothetical protein